jgi:hypothetical protein
MHDLIVTNTHNPVVTRNRYDVLKEIREQLGPNTPRTIRLIDALIAAWDTIDLLTEILSTEQAQMYIQAGFEQVEVIDDNFE